MSFKIYLFETGEQEYVAANSLKEAVDHAKAVIDDMEEHLEEEYADVTELTEKEMAELQIRISDEGEEDVYHNAVEYINAEIAKGQTLPYFFMASYF